MKLGTFSYNGRTFPGMVNGDQVFDLSQAGLFASSEAGKSRKITDLASLLAGEEVLERLLEGRLPSAGTGIIYRLHKVQTLAPVLNPQKIICIGLNYSDHAAESGIDIPEEPVFFTKFNSSIIGPGQSIILPRITKQVDYEAELAVIIGRRGKHIPEEKALEYVAGYTVFNDISARDLQFRGGQWVKGKALDTFAPLGPYLITADEIEDPHNLEIKLWLNDELMQNSNTGRMIFKIPALIAFLSRLFTLEPGDVIATGTPPGVGFVRLPPVFLRPGDKVTVYVERVGTLTNPVTAENTGVQEKW